MAKDPKKALAPTFPSEDVTKDALSRLADARAQKNEAEKDLQEAYFFTRPRLCWDVKSTGSTKRNRDRESEQEDLATGIGSEVSEDFATEVISAFFPQGTKWVESTLDESVLGDVEPHIVNDLKKDAKARDDKIFSAIRASNFEAELGDALDPDASVGTIGLWIDKPHNTRPISVQHIPVRELEINVECDGSIGDRFRVRHVKASKLNSVIGDVALPEKVTRKIKGSPTSKIEVVWCFWRDWSDPENDKWIHVLLVDKMAVHRSVLEGEGCLPLLAARFSPDKEFSWGYGPAIKSLQEFRVLDVITAATQDRVDVAIAPPITYPDDGVLDFENGIEAGKAYPSRPGSGRDIAKLYFEGDPDLGFYTATDLERRIRRKFFADYPEQKGDTPPTATQWSDEMVRAQRRIGTPGKKFWREGPYEIYRRFEWLLKKDGKIEEIALEGRPIPLIPNNPATQAADNQRLQTGVQVLNIAKNYFPETSAAAIDERATIENFQKLAKDDVVVLRDQEQTRDLLQTVLGAAQEAGALPTGGEQ
ncbi:head-to-tail joining protein [Sinorhizobium meliloti CCNWSX0020]|uniref:Head-to-tail joining protein n=1 Tax=Sinorhizobium meliloti CCNWSX0020 TaxID=1107881 RepID=H0FZ17_RHIML|nr:portal protein [Sinorhizobium meliloti]EHK77697.1 head-to-tail joining protein [Sinorhizobium meliloti CCNWSX0020]